MRYNTLFNHYLDDILSKIRLTFRKCALIAANAIWHVTIADIKRSHSIRRLTCLKSPLTVLDALYAYRLATLITI